MEVRNAMIESVRITNEDHGMLTIRVGLDYGGSCQGFGGFALWAPGNPLLVDYTGIFLWNLLEVAGVSDLSKLVGRPVRVRRAPNGHGPVLALGHFLRETWFDPKAAFAAAEEAGKI